MTCFLIRGIYYPNGNYVGVEFLALHGVLFKDALPPNPTTTEISVKPGHPKPYKQTLKTRDMQSFRERAPKGGRQLKTAQDSPRLPGIL